MTPVIVCTEHRGVVFGYTKNAKKDPIKTIDKKSNECINIDEKAPTNPEATIPPASPAQVLLGLTFGMILRLPSSFPQIYWLTSLN